MINRCPKCWERGDDKTRCFLDVGHRGEHKWFGDPGKPPVLWPNVSAWQRVTRRVIR